MKVNNKIAISFFILFVLMACHNVEKEYYESGQLKSKTRIKEGVKEGRSEHFFENGRLAAFYNYDNGKKNGPYEIYHENGELSKKGLYHNDVLEGEVVQLTDKGDTLLKQTYKKGEIIVDILYRQGKPARKMDFSANLMTIFDEMGNIKTEVDIKK